MSAALHKLEAAQRSNASLVSIGLEPSPKSLPAGFEPTIADYERFLLGIIKATSDLACAYKLNAAFFEALGAEGWALMERVRAALPPDALAIIDAKRGDIGSTAERYVEAIYGRLNADAATVNPLMGRDAVAPWLDHTDRLTFFLVLTSNPGASDFLMTDGLYRRIARRLTEWGQETAASGGGGAGGGGHVGFVVGATRADRIREIREIGPEIPFLVPGIGAQGGSAGETIAAGRAAGASPGLMFHVTRGILPGPEEEGEPMEIIRRKAARWRDSINAALDGSHGGSDA